MGFFSPTRSGLYPGLYPEFRAKSRVQGHRCCHAPSRRCPMDQPGFLLSPQHVQEFVFDPCRIPLLPTRASPTDRLAWHGREFPGSRCSPELVFLSGHTDLVPRLEPSSRLMPGRGEHSLWHRAPALCPGMTPPSRWVPRRELRESRQEFLSYSCWILPFQGA